MSWLVSSLAWSVACLPCIAACSDDEPDAASGPDQVIPDQVAPADFVGTWVVTESVSHSDCGDVFKPPAVGSTTEIALRGDHLLESSKDGSCDLELMVDSEKATLLQLPYACSNNINGTEFKLTALDYGYHLVDDSHLTKSYTVDITVSGASGKVSCQAEVELRLTR